MVGGCAGVTEKIKIITSPFIVAVVGFTSSYSESDLCRASCTSLQQQNYLIHCLTEKIRSNTERKRPCGTNNGKLEYTGTLKYHTCTHTHTHTHTCSPVDSIDGVVKAHN